VNNCTVRIATRRLKTLESGGAVVSFCLFRGISGWLVGWLTGL
jgi:hypothetical protein